MMLLYFSPGASSLSPHIVLREAGLPFELVQVFLSSGLTKKTAAGIDFDAINPKSYVPTLELADGEILTEGPAMVQYIADQAPERELAPPPGSFERVRLQEWLNFISTEIHKTFSSLVDSKAEKSTRERMVVRLARRLSLVEEKLAGRAYLMGDRFSVADAYLYTILRWAPKQGIDLGSLPRIASYVDRVAARPAVIAALEAEGLHHVPAVVAA
jgi:glutathione S-transferase